MTCRVFWKRTALRTLAAIWNSSPDPNAVTRAAHYIERLLMIDPLHEGQPFVPTVSHPVRYSVDG